MKTFTLDEIINKHNQPINHFSKELANTELEKYKNSSFRTKSDKEFTFNGKNGKLTCIRFYNGSDHKEMTGYYLMVFNDKEELIENTFPSVKLFDKTKDSVEEVLHDLNLI